MQVFKSASLVLFISFSFSFLSPGYCSGPKPSSCKLALIAVEGELSEFITTIIEDRKKRPARGLGIRVALDPMQFEGGALSVYTPSKIYNLIETENRARNIHEGLSWSRIENPREDGLRLYHSSYSALNSNSSSLGYAVYPIHSLSDLIGFLEDHSHRIARSLNMDLDKYLEALHGSKVELKQYLPDLFSRNISETENKMNAELKSTFSQLDPESSKWIKIQATVTPPLSSRNLWHSFLDEMNALGIDTNVRWIHNIAALPPASQEVTLSGRPQHIRRALLHPFIKNASLK